MRHASRAFAILLGAVLAVNVLAVPTAATDSNVTLSRVLGRFTRPVLVTHAPGKSRVIFIVEQTGKIKRAVFRDGRWKKLGTFLDLGDKILDPLTDGSERGLLGLAFHPGYRTNGRFYVNYTRAGSDAAAGDTVVAEYRRQRWNKADAASGRVLMVLNQPAANHNGGHMAFGPDGLLYIATGDGGGAGDPDGNGQRLTTRLGKILRIDPIDPDGDGPRRYRTPRSNPLVGRSGSNDIWAWGLRNPWRFSFDRRNGDLWIGDVGQGQREEVDRARSDARGKNAGKGNDFGWNRCEGTRQYPDASRACGLGTLPLHDYAHGSDACSVTGGYVHRGPDAPAWRGLYVAGDFCGRLFVLNASGKVKLSKTTSRRISSFGEDAAGRIFAADLTRGTIYRVKFSGPRP